MNAAAKEAIRTHFSTSASMVMLVSGGAHSGKTRKLVEHVAALLDAGTDPESILVLAASPDAATSFARRLSAVHEQGEQVRVTVPRRVLMDVLALPEVQKEAGRKPRLLAPFERDFVFEDVKVSGVRSKRLREMVKFFLRGLTELADWDDDWLVYEEERVVFGLMKEAVEFSGGVLSEELGGIALKVLLQDAQALASSRVAHIVVDDYQLLSRSSQVAARLLADSSLVVAVDEDACIPVYEPYPYAEGADELRASTPSLVEVRLDGCWSCKAAQTAAQAVAVAGGISGESASKPLPSEESGGASIVMTPTPGNEIALVADTIAEALEGGVAPSDVLVAAPHSVWRANVVRALEARGITVEATSSDRVLTGDIRSFERCQAPLLFTALQLVADPADGVAWRSWCGFGDYLTRSNVMQMLHERNLPEGRTLCDALGFLSGSSLFGDAQPPLVPVIHRYKKGLELIQAARGLEGQELLACVAEQCAGVAGLDAGEGTEGLSNALKAIEQLVAPFEDGSLSGDDAQALVVRAHRRLFFPAFDRESCVRIVPFERLVGADPQVLVACGLVNGFVPVSVYFDRIKMPQDKADKLLADDARLLRWALAKANGRLLLTCFDRIDLVAAERLHLKFRRTQLDDEGQRVALVGPSVLFADLSVSSPSSSVVRS